MAKMNMTEDTIAALATPFGEGAVGIVRLSGQAAIAIVDKVFLSKNRRSLLFQKTYSLRYGWIVRRGSASPSTIEAEPRKEEPRKEEIIDEVVVSLMRAPKSYTREDVVEINSHGGAKALSAILELVLEEGARLAEPGEFTKRAFLNGRLDLTQAEAVLDIIQAKGDLALKNGLAQLSGAISKIVGELRRNMLEVLARIEALIDFPEEEIEQAEYSETREILFDNSAQLKNLIERSFKGRVIRDGLKVVIYGRPNVGKSSLLNALLKQERAIVTPIAGTTRDTIEEFIHIKGLAVRLIDTAGMINHRDRIEEEAIVRTKKALLDCDLVLFVVDGSLALTIEDGLLAAQIAHKKILAVINKCDRPLEISHAQVRAILSQGSEVVNVSAMEGKNIDSLEDLIWSSAFDTTAVSPEGAVVANARHIEILKRSLHALETAINSLENKLSMEFIALDLKKSLDTLGELTGEVFSEELLDTIFSKFCIGK